jgi:hypothetical protein
VAEHTLDNFDALTLCGGRGSDDVVIAVPPARDIDENDVND